MRSDEQLPKTRDLETANVSSDPLLIQLLKKRNLKYMPEKKILCSPSWALFVKSSFQILCLREGITTPAVHIQLLEVQSAWISRFSLWNTVNQLLRYNRILQVLTCLVIQTSFKTSSWGDSGPASKETEFQLFCAFSLDLNPLKC